MGETVDASSPATDTIGAAVVPLLALAVFINYVDRGNLATAAPLMKDELSLSNTQIGILLSAFFWSYTPGQLLAGWLAERINAYRALAIGLALWSVATAASGLATSFVALVALRVLLGLGESAAFPCSSKLLAQHLPAHRLGAANGFILIGLGLGPAFGTLIGGLLMVQMGWRAIFLFFGLGSLIWLWPWLVTTRHASARADAQSRARAPSFIAIVRRREAWGASLGHFSNAYTFYFVISWLPLYLVKARGFSVVEMAELGGLIYVVYAASTWLLGWLADRWLQDGASINRVRKTAAVACHVVVATGMLGCAVGDVTISVASLFVAGIGFGFNQAGIFAIGQTLAGPGAGGKWMGVQNCLANLAGIAAPIITGLVVDRTGQFFWAFIVAGAVSLTGILGWAVLIRRVAPVNWAASH